MRQEVRTCLEITARVADGVLYVHNKKIDVAKPDPLQALVGVC